MAEITHNAESSTLWRDLFDDKPTKSQRTQVRIAEAAIRIYAKEGAESATFGRIASSANLSRPLILRYFPTYDALMAFVARFVRAHFQELAVKSIRSATGPKEQVEAYVDCTFDWVLKFPDHAKVWLYYYFLCSQKKSLMTLNTSLVDMGHERITAIVENGQKAGKFSRKIQAADAARQIQIHITGALVSAMTELRKTESLRALTHDFCDAMLRP